MASEFLTSILLWFVRAFVSSAICLVIGFIGIRSITLVTTKTNEFESVKGGSLATALFVTASSFTLDWSFMDLWLISYCWEKRNLADGFSGCGLLNFLFKPVKTN